MIKELLSKQPRLCMRFIREMWFVDCSCYIHALTGLCVQLYAVLHMVHSYIHNYKNEPDITVKEQSIEQLQNF